jgi:diguanylate cyclase (GGDEF)-like protein
MMLIAAIPDNEAARIEALRSYDILDTACEAAFDDIADMARRLIGTPIALVSLIDSERQWFKARQGLDLTEGPRDSSFCAHAILDTCPLVVNDATMDPRFADNPLVTGDPHIRFYAGAPLINPQGFALGTLCIIDTEARVLSPEAEETLRGLARTVGTTLELHRVVKQVHTMAMTDPLTKLANRGAFTDALERGFGHLSRHQIPLELIFLDLDGFKLVNDRYGHAAGDAALVLVARTLRAEVRREDFVARLGGDEFALICSHEDGQDPFGPAERIRAAIEETMKDNGWMITASIGRAVFEAPVAIAEAMRIVDDLMYAAKKSGKNRVRGYTATPPGAALGSAFKTAT